MSVGSSNSSAAESYPALPERDRRKSPRRKPNASSYAVGDTIFDGRVAELNEIIDLNLEGMGIQALWPLTVGHTAEFRLDLNPGYAEVKGAVVWCEQSGRAGVRFTEISENGRRELADWLSADAAAGNPTPEPQPNSERVGHALAESTGDADALLCEIAGVEENGDIRNTDHTSLLAALDAIQREVRSLADDRDAALQLIARRAQVFTRSSGVAIALAEGAEMTCRAIAGPDTPPVGARLQIGSGFSGACVRSGMLLHCQDTETDPIVDRESCRALGIRSMVAAPIRTGGQVTGLLEAFSPRAHNFGAEDEIVLQRLALMVSGALLRPAAQAGNGAQPSAANLDDEFPVETPAALPIPQFSFSRNGLLISAGITVVIAIFWLIGSWDTGHTGARPLPPPVQTASRQGSPAAAVSTNDLEGLRRLAEQGDATAEFALGTRYATGQDVPQDYAEALRWFTQAAEQGNVIAETALASYYWAGRGVSPDPAKAYFWSLVAQAGGDDTSKPRITALEARLSPNDIASAQQQADAWLKQHPVARKDVAPAP